jgi:PAS domain S-box-containing protein
MPRIRKHGRFRASGIYAMFEERARWTNNGTVRWPYSSGEMAGRVREHDWASTPLGPIEGWPQCLKTFVDMLLSNGFAMTVLWGRDLIQIYNDAHRDLIADRHPGALGRPTRDAWAEFWTQAAPVIDRVWAGETLTFFDVPQTVTRRGTAENAWFTYSYSPLRDDTGTVAGMLVTLLETTERMRAQTALRDSESRLRLALEVAELGAWTWDPRDGSGHIDDRGAQIVGLPKGGAVDVAAAQRQNVHPDDLAPLQAAAAEGARTGEPFSLGYRVVDRDGSLRHVVTRGRGLLDAQGNVIRVVGTNRDVTVEREAELRLRASEERFRTLVQSIRDYAIVGLDADGRITEWTGGAGKVIGYSGKSAIGSPVSMLYLPEDVRRGVPEQLLAQARQQGRVAVDGWRVRKDGTRFWANAIVTAIGDETGAIVGYTEVIRDLSEQKELLEQREQLLAEATAARAEAERANQAKDEFLITLSHELRTPLAPILLWARALLEGSVPAQDIDHAVEAIILSAESQLQLIEDLRDLSRLKSGRVQLDRHSNSVEEVARAAVEVILPSAQAKGVIVELDVMPDLGNAVLDGGRFQQVLWNLLSNAVKFTPEGGRVSLHVRRRDDQLEVVVADTGAGIEASFLPHLFQRFRQAQPDTPERHRYGGLGVGLALCRYLVELHGGTVEGTSEGPGRGAVFRLLVPWVTPDVAPATDEQDVLIGGPTPSALLGLKVLLVEDDPNMRDIMRWTLEGAGASVVPVSTGSEAIEVIAAGEQAAAAPDVMVCDLGLPGMNGFDLIERICEQRRSLGQRAIPACAVSAFAREVDRERAIDAGFDSYLAKPMTAQRLIDAVEELAAVAADDRA